MQVSAFGVEIDEAVGDEGVGTKARLEDVGVESAAFVELFVLGVLQEEIEASAGKRCRAHQVMFIRTRGEGI